MDRSRITSKEYNLYIWKNINLDNATSGMETIPIARQQLPRATKHDALDII